jgi:S-DNA-T family DNA segregation ATPase FtsK/SpoIIIE
VFLQLKENIQKNNKNRPILLSVVFGGITKKMAKETRENKEKDTKESIISGDIKKSIAAVVLIMVALIFVLSLIGKAGVVGQYINKFLAVSLGWGRYGLPVLMVIVGLVYFKKLDPIRYYLTSIGAGILLFFLLTIFHLFFNMDEMVGVAERGAGGGYLGLSGGYLLAKYLGKAGGYIVSFSGILIGLILTFNFPLNKSFCWTKDIWEKLKQYFQSRKAKGKEGETESEEGRNANNVEEEADDKKTENNIKLETIEFVEDPNSQSENSSGEERNNKNRRDNIYIEKSGQSTLFHRISPKKRRANSSWKLPGISNLDLNGKKSNPKNLEKNAEIIKKTLHDFGVEVEFSGYNVGPTVVQYTFKPAVGVLLSRIISLQGNISLNLAASSVRIEAPIPGKSLVGVEVPLSDKEKALVRMRTMIESAVFQERNSNLSIILGEDVNGDIVIGQLEKMPHLLIAGSTNTGKSVCINSILISLLYQNSPDDLKLILVDPKRVELSLYNGIPHLLTPVIVDTAKVVGALKWVIGEMETRYRLLQEVSARDIHSYNEKAEKGETKKKINKETGKHYREAINKIPFIVIVIDELADLMVMHGREVETIIIRLAQMARAVGIHLIVSTQRPSVDVLTGIIKANITTRIAFQVATQVDSRTILDMAGAEKLLGNGDMLYASTQSPKPRRIQGVFVSEQEVKKVVKEIKEIAREANYRKEDENVEKSLNEYLTKSDLSDSNSEGFSSGKDKIILENAKKIVIETGRASTTFLQRRLGVGYPKAANIMDMLEEQGIVGPAEGQKPRQVLVKSGPNYQDSEKDQQEREQWEK